MSPRAASGGKRTTKTSRQARGRVWVAAGLVAFLALASLVVWRRSVGIGTARQIRALDTRRVQLEGERAAIESDIRQAASRTRIGAVAEQRLGMRVPADTQVVILPRPAPGAGTGVAPVAPAPPPDSAR